MWRLRHPSALQARAPRSCVRLTTRILSTPRLRKASTVSSAISPAPSTTTLAFLMCPDVFSATEAASEDTERDCD